MKTHLLTGPDGPLSTHGIYDSPLTHDLKLVHKTMLGDPWSIPSNPLTTMYNPFEVLNARLEKLEALITERLPISSSVSQTPDIGGLPLAQEVTRLSKARIYALVSARSIPHSKRGNKLYFNRAELLAWVNAGKRNEK